MILRAPRYTLFPYTTLFRSEERAAGRVLHARLEGQRLEPGHVGVGRQLDPDEEPALRPADLDVGVLEHFREPAEQDRKSTRLNSSHITISYAVFCLKKKRKT